MICAVDDYTYRSQRPCCKSYTALTTKQNLPLPPSCAVRVTAPEAPKKAGREEDTLVSYITVTRPPLPLSPTELVPPSTLHTDRPYISSSTRAQAAPACSGGASPCAVQCAMPTVGHAMAVPCRRVGGESWLRRLRAHSAPLLPLAARGCRVLSPRRVSRGVARVHVTYLRRCGAAPAEREHRSANCTAFRVSVIQKSVFQYRCVTQVGDDLGPISSEVRAKVL